jgi:hypothetical protein
LRSERARALWLPIREENNPRSLPGEGRGGSTIAGFGENRSMDALSNFSRWLAGWLRKEGGKDETVKAGCGDEGGKPFYLASHRHAHHERE